MAGRRVQEVRAGVAGRGRELRALLVRVRAGLPGDARVSAEAWGRVARAVAETWACVTRGGCGWPSSGRAGAVLGGWGPCRGVLAESVGQQDSRQWRLGARQLPGRAARGGQKFFFFFEFLYLKIYRKSYAP